MRRTLDPFIEPDLVTKRVEKAKASIRAKVERPFRVPEREFGFGFGFGFGFAKVR